jgi:hypothetical protein
MKIIKKRLAEAHAEPTDLKDILSNKAARDKLIYRKAAVIRIIEDAERAIKKAEELGKDELADKLHDGVDMLQSLLDGSAVDELADEPDVEDTGSSDTKKADKGIGGEDETEDADGDAGAESEESTSAVDSEEGSSESKARSSSSDTDVSDADDGSESRDSGSSKTDSKEDTRDKSKTDKATKGAGSGGSAGGNDDDVEPSDADAEAGAEGKDTDIDTGDDDSDTVGSGGEAGDDSAKTADKKDTTDDSDTKSGGGSSDDSDADDDSYSDGPIKIKDNKILIDPFKKRAGGGKLPKELQDKLDNHELDIESKLDAAKRILSKLSGDAKQGAMQGLKDILAARGVTFTESMSRFNYLTEALGKTLEQLSDEELDTILSSVQSLVDQVLDDINYSDDLDDRIKAIAADAANRYSRYELDAEDEQYLKDDPAIKARKADAERVYSRGKALRGLEDFEKTLFSAMADQVDKIEDDVETWAALDRRHEDDPSILKKGSLLDDVDEEIPTLNIYFDQSGSWSNAEIAIGKKAIKSIYRFKEEGTLDLNIFYISAIGVCDTAEEARRYGGAEGWHATLQHIVSSGAKNVVVLSDSDLDSYEWSNRPNGNNGRVVVDGCVWWLWKNGMQSKKAPKELIGRMGNFHNRFSC